MLTVPGGIAQLTVAGVPVPFLWTSLIIELTPGPNMTYLALLTLADGRRAGLAAVAGIATGLAAIGALAAFGVAAVVAESPTLYAALRWTGVFYLAWLAFQMWRGEELGDPSLADGVSDPWPIYFRRGLITNLLNPKAAIFYIAVLPTFLSVEAAREPLRQTLTLSFAYVAVATAVHTAIVILAARLRPHLENSRRMDVVRRLLAAALLAVAAWLIWSTRVVGGP